LFDRLAFVCFDGEPIQINAFIENELLLRADSNDILLNKISASCSGKLQMCDVSKKFMSQKKLLKSASDREEWNNPTLQFNLEFIFNSRPRSLSSGYIKLSIKSLLQLTWVVHRTSSNHIVYESYYQTGSFGKDPNFIKTLRQCNNKKFNDNPRYINRMIEVKEDLCRFIRAQGQLTEAFMTEKGIVTIEEIDAISNVNVVEDVQVTTRNDVIENDEDNSNDHQLITNATVDEVDDDEYEEEEENDKGTPHDQRVIWRRRSCILNVNYIANSTKQKEIDKLIAKLTQKKKQHKTAIDAVKMQQQKVTQALERNEKQKRLDEERAKKNEEKLRREQEKLKAQEDRKEEQAKLKQMNATEKTVHNLEKCKRKVQVLAEDIGYLDQEIIKKQGNLIGCTSLVSKVSRQAEV
jgi:hypothetical protein